MHTNNEDVSMQNLTDLGTSNTNHDIWFRKIEWLITLIYAKNKPHHCHDYLSLTCIGLYITEIHSVLYSLRFRKIEWLITLIYAKHKPHHCHNYLSLTCIGLLNLNFVASSKEQIGTATMHSPDV